MGREMSVGNDFQDDSRVGQPPKVQACSLRSDLLGFREHALLTAFSLLSVVRVLAGAGPRLSGRVALLLALSASLDVLPPLLEVLLDAEDVVDGFGQEGVDLGLDVRIGSEVVLGELDAGDLLVDLFDEVTEALLRGRGDVVVLGLLRLLGRRLVLAGGAGLGLRARLGDLGPLGLQVLTLLVDVGGHDLELLLEFRGDLGLVMLLEESGDLLGDGGVDLCGKERSRLFGLLGLEGLGKGVDDGL